MEFNQKEKTVDMCQAIAEMRKEERLEGRLEGKAEGRTEGRTEGERMATIRINKLNSILIAANRYEDLKRASEDVSYQNELIAELLADEEIMDGSK